MTNLVASIKVLTYNHERFIKRCLDGLLEQKTNYSFEIVVGDDASVDNTRDILLDYQSKYPDVIRLFLFKERKGLLINDRRTVLKTKGKYQLICDGDDYWIDPLKLQKQVDFMEASPGHSLVFSDVILVDEHDREIEPSPYFVERRSLYREGDVFWYLWKKNFINTSAVCLRNDIYKNVLPATENDLKKLWFVHDYWYMLQLARKGKVGYMDEKMMAYRTHSENVTIKGNFLQKRLPMVFIDVARSLSKQEADTREKREEIAKKMIWILLRKDLLVKMKMGAFGVLLRYFPSVPFILKNIKPGLFIRK